MVRGFSHVFLIAFLILGNFYTVIKADIDEPDWTDISPDDPVIVKMCRRALALYFREKNLCLQNLEITRRRNAQRKFFNHVYYFMAEFSASSCATCRAVLHCSASQSVKPWTTNRDIEVHCHQPYMPDMDRPGFQDIQPASLDKQTYGPFVGVIVLMKLGLIETQLLRQYLGKELMRQMLGQDLGDRKLSRQDLREMQMLRNDPGAREQFRLAPLRSGGEASVGLEPPFFDIEPPFFD